MLKNNTQKRKLEPLSKPNYIGLKLNFNLNGDVARAEFVLDENHQRYPGYAHQGILALLIDQGFGWLARHFAGVNSVTATMDLIHHEPVKIGEPLIMMVQIIKNNRRLLEESVRIETKDGKLLTEGTCLQYVMGFQDESNTLRD